MISQTSASVHCLSQRHRSAYDVLSRVVESGPAARPLDLTQGGEPVDPQAHGPERNRRMLIEGLNAEREMTDAKASFDSRRGPAARTRKGDVSADHHAAPNLPLRNDSPFPAPKVPSLTPSSSSDAL